MAVLSNHAVHYALMEGDVRGERSIISLRVHHIGDFKWAEKYVSLKRLSKSFGLHFMTVTLHAEDRDHT